MTGNDTNDPLHFFIPANTLHKLLDDHLLSLGEKQLCCLIAFYCYSGLNYFCIKGNEFFARLLRVSEKTISKWIHNLLILGYITIDYSHSSRKKNRLLSFTKVKRNGKPIPDSVNAGTIIACVKNYLEGKH